MLRKLMERLGLRHPEPTDEELRHARDFLERITADEADSPSSRDEPPKLPPERGHGP